MRDLASVTVAMPASVSRACRSMSVSRSRVWASLPCASRQRWRRLRSSACAERCISVAASAAARAVGRAARLRLLRGQCTEAAALGQPAGGGHGAWAAATNPSQRHRSPSRETRRWPAAGFCRRGPSPGRRCRSGAGAGSTRAVPQRAKSAARRPWAGPGRSAAGLTRQCTGASSRPARRGPRRAPRRAPFHTGRHLDLIEHRRQTTVPAGINSLASVSTSVLSLPAANPSCAAVSALALASLRAPAPCPRR